MKRLIVFLFVLLAVSGSFCFVSKIEPIFAVDGVDKVCFVSSAEFGGRFESVKCGDKFFNFCTFEEAKEKASLVKTCDAVQFYAKQSDLKKLLAQIKFQQLSCEEIEGIEICYGFSPCYASAVLLDGKKVNVQIAKVDGNVIVGFPMILTGF